MIEWIIFGGLVAGITGTAWVGALYLRANRECAELINLRDKWRGMAESQQNINKNLDEQYMSAVDDRNMAQMRVRLQRYDLARLRTDNQVLENTIFARKNEVEAVKVLHRDIERDMGERIKELKELGEKYEREQAYGTIVLDHYYHQLCQAEGYRSAIRHLSVQLDKARANDLRDAKGRFVSRRPKRGTGQRT